MKIKQLKSQFNFNRSQRVGILLLVAIIIGLLYVNFFIVFSEENTFDISSAEMVETQRKIDALRLAEIARKKPKHYPFNPNFITDYKAYTLGITPEEYDRLKKFRKSNQWINSIHDFKSVTQVSDSLLHTISPYFKFPDWVTHPRPKKKYNKKVTSEISFSEKIDLNKATQDALQQVNGVGEVLSKRIIERREKLGGFSDDLQLNGIWGLRPEVVQRILLRFTVKTPKTIYRININATTASDLATIPGVSFEMGKKIWELLRLRDGVADLSEILKIEGITPRKLQLIKLYLYAE